MKKVLLFALSLAFMAACTETKKENSEAADATQADSTLEAVDVKTKTFDELFQAIDATALTDNVFKTVGQDFTVITAGDTLTYNSMTASFGGWGLLFEKPVTWCFLRANRYTLELMKKEETYTMSYFDDQYKDQVLFFGSKTGKGTNKMKETTLTNVLTPSGNTTYKEARLILECKLMEITTVSPKDFYKQEYIDFIESGYKDAKAYHKLVFGEITKIWVKK
ncbi:flavin reductase [Viscerimonas tarda]